MKGFANNVLGSLFCFQLDKDRTMQMVFIVKYKVDGTIEQLKVRFVAKGFARLMW